MISKFIALFTVALVPASQAAVEQSSDQVSANPVRKVVTLLQKMQKRIEEEGEKEEELYKKFMCYCKTGKGDLQASVSSATAKAPQLSSDIKSSEEQLTQLKADLKQAQADRS